MMDKKIELLDENGKSAVFVVVADFKMDSSEYGDSRYDGNEYAILVMEDSDSDEALVFKIIEEDSQEPIFSVVDDDDEFDAVSKFYEYIMSENEEH